jgi:hypothetical protein
VGGAADPDAVVAGDRQHVADLSGFQLGPQFGVGAVDLVAGDPACWDAGVKGAGQHRRGQSRLGREPDLVGDTGRLQALGIVGPGPGQVQRPVDQGVPSAGGVDQVDRDLGVVDPPGGAGVLALHPTVVVPFFRPPVASMTSTAPGSPRCSTT